jgi:hypothetical protein
MYAIKRAAVFILKNENAAGSLLRGIYCMKVDFGSAVSILQGDIFRFLKNIAYGRTSNGRLILLTAAPVLWSASNCHANGGSCEHSCFSPEHCGQD